MTGHKLDWNSFEAALTTAERDALAAIVRQLQDPSADREQVRVAFFSLAATVVSRIGHGAPGPLWGELKKQHQSAREAVGVPWGELPDALPYPLGLKLRELLHAGARLDGGEAEPQLAFELCAVMGVLVRMAALVTIQAYVRAGKNDAAINHAVVEKLRAPSDGGWLEVALRVSRALQGADAPFARRVADALASKPSVNGAVRSVAQASTTQQALQALVKFRNDLVHGERISPERLSRARAQLEVAVRGFAWLADYRLEVFHAERLWLLSGAVPRPVDEPSELPPDEPCLVHRGDRRDFLSLSPLLRFRAGASDDLPDVDIDELFFLNAGSQERLSYIGYRSADQVDGKALGSYDAFKAFMAKIPTPPIPEDPRIDFASLAAFHSRLFVGREGLLHEIAEAVAAGEHQYVVLRALAGMGKSAVCASLLQAVLNLRVDEGERVPSAADGLVRAQDKWACHFCMPTGGRDSPTVALRSLIAQICDHFDLPRERWLSQDVDELKDEKFPALLARVGPQLEEGARLVVLVDALDEGIGGESESVPSCLPGGTYQNVVFLLSYRVDQERQNRRVEAQMQHLPAERLLALEHANPLSGLDEGDVDRFLARLAEVFEVEEATGPTRAVVWDAASRDAVAGFSDGADPFYLRFVADGVQQGTVRLDRPETIPGSLDDAFEHMWMGLPSARDFLCHRVLLTLAIMRDYGDDELFATLFNRDRPADDTLTPNDVAAVRVQAGKLLVYDGDRYGLFHDRFRVFLVGEQRDPITEALDEA